jgi:hypothetical protein
MEKEWKEQYVSPVSEAFELGLEGMIAVSLKDNEYEQEKW